MATPPPPPPPEPSSREPEPPPPPNPKRVLATGITVTPSSWTGSPKIVDTCALLLTVSPIRSSSSFTNCVRSCASTAITHSFPGYDLMVPDQSNPEGVAETNSPFAKSVDCGSALHGLRLRRPGRSYRRRSTTAAVTAGSMDETDAVSDTHGSPPK